MHSLYGSRDGLHAPPLCELRPLAVPGDDAAGGRGWMRDRPREGEEEEEEQECVWLCG